MSHNACAVVNSLKAVFVRCWYQTREMLPMETMNSSSTDQDARTGAIEEERPGGQDSGAPGLDGNGLPNDAIAIAQDAVGAREDGTQG